MLCVYTVVDMHLEYLRLLTLYRTCSCRPGGIPQRPKSTDLPTISPVPAHTPQRGWALWVQSVRVSLDAAPKKVGREQQEQRQQGLQQGQDHLDENPGPLPQGAVARR